MEAVFCRDCYSLDPKRTNEEGKARCVSQHKFVDPMGKACPEFYYTLEQKEKFDTKFDTMREQLQAMQEVAMIRQVLGGVK